MHHHLVSEPQQKTFCIYCGRNVPRNEWSSEWHLEAHYKTIKCQCGKNLHIKVNFEGSGHDSWNWEKIRPAALKKKSIEDRIKILESPEVVERHYPKGK